jgi:hypothetical protein
MKLYLAAIYTSNFHKTGPVYARLTDHEKLARDGIEHILESYHYIHRQSFVEKIREDKTSVFLDSGAFSAFTKGVDVDIRGYCEYIKRNKDIIEKVDGILCASVLDGIGDPLKTYENQCMMESLGAKPLPCFHYGEDERYLEYYIANYDYITLGGMVPISTPQLILWLDRIWEKYLTDGAGHPKIRVHGFGLTTIVLMERYPWFSVDSSSWAQISAFGNIMLPGYGPLSVSVNSPSAKDYNRHINTLPEIQRLAIIKQVTDYGFDIERLKSADGYGSRWCFNTWSFGELGKALTAEKKPIFENKQMELF